MMVKAMVSTRTLANNPTFPGNLVLVKLQAPFFLYIISSPSYLFWKCYICQTCQGFLMNQFFMIHVGFPCRLSLPPIFQSLSTSLVKTQVITRQIPIYGAHQTCYEMTLYNCVCFNALLSGVPQNSTSISTTQYILTLMIWLWFS
jgi:hypothetical protein